MQRKHLDQRSGAECLGRLFNSSFLANNDTRIALAGCNITTKARGKPFLRITIVLASGSHRTTQSQYQPTGVGTRSQKGAKDDLGVDVCALLETRRY